MKSVRRQHESEPLLSDAAADHHITVKPPPLSTRSASATNSPEHHHHHDTRTSTGNTGSSSSGRPTTPTSVRSALAKVLGGLFRSHSDPNVRPPSPPRRRLTTGPPRSVSASPCSTTAAAPASTRAAGGQRRRHCSANSGSGGPTARRRFQRVVRNENARPPDQADDNPFVVRKFDQEYLTKYWSEKQKSSQDSQYAKSSTSSIGSISSHPGGGHTILKKSYGSGDHLVTQSDLLPGGSSGLLVDQATSASASVTPNTADHRHAKFREVVEIVEFRLRDRVKTGLHVTHEERLLFDDDLLDAGITASADLDVFEMDGSAGLLDVEDHDPILAAVPLRAVGEGDAETVASDDGSMRNIFSSLCNVDGCSSPTVKRSIEQPPTKHIRLLANKDCEADFEKLTRERNAPDTEQAVDSPQQ